MNTNTLCWFDKLGKIKLEKIFTYKENGRSCATQLLPITFTLASTLMLIFCFHVIKLPK